MEAISLSGGEAKRLENPFGPRVRTKDQHKNQFTCLRWRRGVGTHACLVKTFQEARVISLKPLVRDVAQALLTAVLGSARQRQGPSPAPAERAPLRHEALRARVVAGRLFLNLS
jgi:hypothetical protein